VRFLVDLERVVAGGFCLRGGRRLRSDYKLMVIL
jgi:hypothetical protein